MTVAMKERLKKVFTHPAMISFGMFLVIFAFYFIHQGLLSIAGFAGYIKTLYWVMIGGVILTFVILWSLKKIGPQHIAMFILIFALALRLIYSNNNSIFTHQHDVGKAFEHGHYGYAVTIFRTGKLPASNDNQFYQPPLNALLQSFGMRLATLFFPCPESVRPAYDAMFGNTTYMANEGLTAYIDTLYSFTRIFSCFYSIMTVYMCHLILKEMNIGIRKHIIILSFVSVQPVLTMMSGTMNNDNLSYMFFFMALLFAVKWYYHPTYEDSIFLAVSIGLGMITKLSIGFSAVIIGPMMLVRIVKEIKAHNTKDILLKTGLFAIIVAPLGLWYAIRNMVMFDQSLTYILDFGRGSWLHENIAGRSFFERFLSLPPSQMFHEKYGIFHDYREYNVWVDLLKTSVFEEFSYSSVVRPFATILLFDNIILCFLAIPAAIYCFINVFRKKIQGKSALLLIISSAFLALGLISYVSLTVTMPYSCSSNFRYVSYLSFMVITLFVFAVDSIPLKGIRLAGDSLIGIFEIMSILFVMIL